jgi:hypothetical protein
VCGSRTSSERRGERVAQRRIDVAVRTYHEQARITDLACHESQEQQRRLVRGVQIVEHQDNRACVAGAPQEFAGGVEQPEARARLLRGRGLRQSREQLAQLGQELSQIHSTGAELRCQHVAVGRANVAPQRLHPRPVRGSASRLPASPDQNPGTARPRLAEHLLGQPGLADPRLAGQENQAPATGERVVECAGQRGELALATDEHARRVRRAALLGRRCVELERGVLPQERLVELLELPAGFDAELLDEHRPRRPVGVESLGLAAASVERQHQLSVQPLPQRVLGDERLELGHEIGVTAGGEIGVDPLLERGDPHLLHPRDLGLGESLVREVGERRPAPQRERLAERRRRLLRTRAGGVRDEPLKAGDVELRRLELDRVAGRAGDEPAVAELLAEPRDVDVDALCDRRRRRLAPQLVDEPLGRDHLIRMQQQQHQQRALLAPAERKRAVLLGHFQRTEKPEFHFGSGRPYRNGLGVAVH